jgi:hypothetical protein
MTTSAEFDRKNTLLDRALRGDAEAAQELGFEFADDQQEPDPEDEQEYYGGGETPTPWHVEWIEQQQVKENLARSTPTSTGSQAVQTSGRLGPAGPSAGIDRRRLQRACDRRCLQAVGRTPDARKRTGQFEQWKKSKTAPHVSPGGTGATETPYRDDMSVRELTEGGQRAVPPQHSGITKSPGRLNRLGDNHG